MNAIATLDLDSDDSGGTSGNDYRVFINGGSSINTSIADNDVTLTDDDGQFSLITITADNINDTGEESLQYAALPALTLTDGAARVFNLNTVNGAEQISVLARFVGIDANTFTITFAVNGSTNQGQIYFTNAEIVNIIDQLSYINADLTDPADRIFDITVTDSSNVASHVARFTVDIQQDPIANDDSGVGFTTDEDASFITSNVLSNDTDPDVGQTLSVSGLDTDDTIGLVVDLGNGTFSYDPNSQFESLALGQSTTDTFDYDISDGFGGNDTATVTITINGVADAPEISNLDNTFVTYNDSDPATLLAIPFALIDEVGLSTTGGATLEGLSIADDDLVLYNFTTDSASIEVDESAESNFTSSVDAAHKLANGNFVVSFNSSDDQLFTYDPVLDQLTSFYSAGVGGSGGIESVYVFDDGSFIFSTEDNGVSFKGVNFDNEDLVHYDPVLDTATLFFDGSAQAGTNERITGFHLLSNGNYLLSFQNNETIGGISAQTDDIVEYNPTTDTATLYFDGNANFSSGENIDSIYQVLDTNVIVSDVDSPDFDTGTLTVSVLGGVVASETFAIQNVGTGAGEIDVAGSDVRYEGTVIGSFSGGNGVDLVITLNDQADHLATAALISNITYENSTVVPTAVRQVTFTLNDGGGASTTSTVNVMSDDSILDGVQLSGEIVGGAGVTYENALAGVKVSLDEPVSTVILTTGGTESLPGATNFQDEDLVTYNFTSTTASLFFDGSASPASLGGEDIRGIQVLATGAIAFSTEATFTLGGTSFADEDIVAYDPLTNRTVLLFDGSAVFTDPTGEDVDAFYIQDDGTIILSTTAAASIGATSFNNEDLIQYDPLTGNATVFFDASTVGLTDDIDAFHLLNNGNYLLSVVNDGISLGGITFNNGDLVEYNPGTDTASIFFAETLFSDGNANIKGVYIPIDTGTGDALGDTFNNIENLIGSDFDDVLQGDSGDNVLQGRLGGDVLLGGDGNDTASYAEATSGVRVSLSNPGDSLVLSVNTETATLGTNSQAGQNEDAFNYNAVADTASLLFDGSSIFTDTAGENIDGLHVLDSGHIVLSTNGAAQIGALAFADEDVIEYDPVTGIATKLFDGIDDFGLASGDDIDGLFIRDNGNVVFSLENDSTITGIGSVSDEDILEYNDGTGQVSQLFDGDVDLGISSDINGIHVLIDGNLVFATEDGQAVRNLASVGDGDLIHYDTNSDLASIYLQESVFSGGNEKINAIYVANESNTGDTLNSIENLIGSGFGDFLEGNDDQNTITGNAGNDDLFGRAANDTLIGGDGDDDLSGGAGDDTFTFNGGDDGNDRILDFNVLGDTDKVEISGFASISDFNDLTSRISNNGVGDGNVSINLSGEAEGGAVIELVGVDTVDSDDFTFS